MSNVYKKINIYVKQVQMYNSQEHIIIINYFWYNNIKLHE